MRDRTRQAGIAVLAALLALAAAPSQGLGDGRGEAPRAKASGRSLDGEGNNRSHPEWGGAGARYLRVARPRYRDGIGAMAAGPPPRFVSNRIFNDVDQNVFSENGLSQWGWAWGQFIDHDMGLRTEKGGAEAPLRFDRDDPLERFRNDFGAIAFARTRAAPGTGRPGAPRQHLNTTSSYIDASTVYGLTSSRLDWLRAGRRDGDPGDNSARLLLPGGYLPTARARRRPRTAPPMDLMGQLAGSPGRAVIAGDVRANENLALTAIQTLLAREHNRIVAALPKSLPARTRFAIARRVVGAEVQFITYTEFLPALGVALPPYRGYRPRVNPGISHEFATVGFRAHSMVHGDFNARVAPGTFPPEQLASLRARGIEVSERAGNVFLGVPLAVTFGNPSLVAEIGLGPVLRSLVEERQYRNEELIDDAIRSVLFQVPRPGLPDPGACGPAVDPDCFTGVLDLGAIDIQRGRDHGIPSYNGLRRAYGLAPRTSFAAITGEAGSGFTDPEIDPADPLDDPDILDFTELYDAGGNPVEPLGGNAVRAVRRASLAARLRAIYGRISRLDAVVGMMSEPHAEGSELGELQRAIWRRQFRALRDGDRFFYLNDPRLARIERRFGIGYRRSLSELIGLNTGTLLPGDVFQFVPPPG